MRILLVLLALVFTFVAEAGGRRGRVIYYQTQPQVIYVRPQPVYPAPVPVPVAPAKPSPLNVSAKESFESFIQWAQLCQEKTAEWKDKAGDARLTRNVAEGLATAESYSEEALEQAEKGLRARTDSLRLYHGNRAARHLVSMALALERALKEGVSTPAQKRLQEMAIELKAWGPRLPASDEE